MAQATHASRSAKPPPPWPRLPLRPFPTSVVPAATPSPSPIPTAVSSADVAAADANPAAARAFVSRLLDSARRALSGARPWAELVNRSALSRPDTLSDATSRLGKNLAYFRANYAAVVALSLAAALLAHPFSLAALLALLAAWCLLYVLRPADAPPLSAFRRTFSGREVPGGLIASSAFVIFLTSVGSLMFSALALGAAVVCAHSAFRVPEDLFLDEPDHAASSGNQKDEDDDGGSLAAVLLLPDDMLAEVLRRLSPRSLAASRCVREQWRSIIDARRMLRVDLLPLQLDGFFRDTNDFEARPSFFAPPSTMRRIITGGCLDDIYDTLGYMSIADHCNGLLLLGQQMVVNPATRQWATLPALPSPSSSGVDDQLLRLGYHQLIVYDPMVSPQHYELISHPHVIYHQQRR
ncbi:PRA1 family protein B2-like [Panicum miliaceum]|uniref:PRA1 family protein B2-like n=1 Tax=Panicum miliaceum TaxID=4540 RepID=A0A3L6RIS0_PANMI|nr:PRA1 family protein B2-like [Panicum miliaceum]